MFFSVQRISIANYTCLWCCRQRQCRWIDCKRCIYRCLFLPHIDEMWAQPTSQPSKRSIYLVSLSVPSHPVFFIPLFSKTWTVQSSCVTSFNCLFFWFDWKRKQPYRNFVWNELHAASIDEHMVALENLSLLGLAICERKLKRKNDKSLFFTRIQIERCRCSYSS